MSWPASATTSFLRRQAEKRLLPVLNRFKRTLSTVDVNEQTTKPTVELTKSHLNRAPILSEFERAAIRCSRRVRAGVVLHAQRSLHRFHHTLQA